MTSKLRLYLATAIIAVGVLLLGLISTDFAITTQPVWSPSALLHADDVDHIVGQTTEIFDDAGNLVSKMARNVGSGDEIINAAGQHYQIEKVDGNKATAKLLGIDKEYFAYVDYFANLKEVPVVANNEQKNRPIGIYSTHTDESYVPTDGTESKPFKGGILEVGKELSNRLQQAGVNILYSDNSHDPHDSNAYIRSRRTATELMKQNPTALIDVHRDGIPDPNYYEHNIAGRDVTQIRLVVGKQNPKMQSNMDFAKRLMAYTNQQHPDLVKEIFVGKGNYNQDLMPTAILIEAGTHTNERERAEEGVALLADAVPVVLGVGSGAAGGGQAGGPGTEVSEEAGNNAWSTLGWILGILLIGGGAFLLMSTGSLKGAAEKITGFSKEMTSFMAPAKKKQAINKRVTDQDESSDPISNEKLKDARDEVTKD
ncbi:stage II sporulation protein P [Peptococcaceae bacterium 1198_IL3148]